MGSKGLRHIHTFPGGISWLCLTLTNSHLGLRPEHRIKMARRDIEKWPKYHTRDDELDNPGTGTGIGKNLCDRG